MIPLLRKLRNYRCRDCGYMTSLERDHAGPAWSVGLQDRCPRCLERWELSIPRTASGSPPRTFWICEDDPEGGHVVGMYVRKRGSIGEFYLETFLVVSSIDTHDEIWKSWYEQFADQYEPLHSATIDGLLTHNSKK